MNYYADIVGATVTDVEAMPWIPFLPYSEQLHLKIIRLNPVNGEWVALLHVPAGMEMPKHCYLGTVQTMLKRYDDYCIVNGLKPADITSFAGN